MSPICWARVDDRLIHGQVTVAWRRHLHYDEICIVDDAVSADPFLRDVLRMAAPDDVSVQVYTMQEAVAALTSPGARETLLLVESPQTALALVERGVPLEHLNVGNLAPGAGSVRVFKSISLDSEHVAALDALAARGVHITFQLTPDDVRVDWQAVRQRIEPRRRGGHREN
jgi:mannose/fructose/N-acetylgalactosamine-specific phosphotransferase system component IIB